VTDPMPEPGTVEPHTDAVIEAVGDAAFVQAVQRARGSVGSTESVQELLDAGLTAGVVETLRQVAAWTLEVDAALAGLLAPDDVYCQMEVDLKDLLTDRSDAGLLEVGLGWAIIEAGAPDSASVEQVDEIRARITPEDQQAFENWLPFEAAGPLAWAAGLTPEEMAERLRAGTLDAHGLEMLAVLRGWRFPDEALLPWRS
jgi:hypothetical protein